MKNKIFSLLFAIIASTNLLLAESGTCGENLTWDLTDSVLTINGTGAMTDYSSAPEVPWYLQRSSINSVIVSQGVTSIGNCAFLGCSSLKSIIIPNSVTSIKAWAFYHCIDLTSVIIPSSITSIGYEAFSGCCNLPVEDNLRYADTYLVEVVDKTLTTSHIKQGTRWIGNYAFRECTELTSVDIPNSITSVGDYAFYGCSGLTSVVIPINIISIGSGAFYGCSSLTAVEWNAMNCSDFSYFSTSPFYSIRSQITSFTFGDVVEYIPRYLCEGMNNLTSISIPSSVTSIGNSAFYNCSRLTSLEIPNSVTNIGNAAFSACSSLTSVEIPNSVTRIGNSAFEYCTNLCYIICKANTPPQAADNTFNNIDRSIPLYIPEGSLDLYKVEVPWRKFTNYQPYRPNPNCAFIPSSLQVIFNNQNAQISWRGGTSAYIVKAYSHELEACVDSIVTSDTTAIFYNLPYGHIDISLSGICENGEHGQSLTESIFSHSTDESCIDYLNLANAICYIENSIPENTITFNDFRQVPAIDYGSASIVSRHTIHFDKNETDFRTGGAAKTIPEGELASVRLGNWDANASAERIEYILNVDSINSPMLLLKYMPVLEEPTHEAEANPRLKYEILINGELIVSEDVNADSLIQNGTLKPQAETQGWHQYSYEQQQYSVNVIWKEWTTVGLSLQKSEYKGKSMMIRLTTHDCAWSGHFGYAYFTVGCCEGELKKKIIGDSKAFEAPDGFYYRWLNANYEQYRQADGSIPEQYILSREKEFIISSSDNNLYMVDCISVFDSTCYFSLYTPLSHGQCGDSLFWVLDNDTLTISGKGNMWDTQPWKGVQTSIKHVILPQGITSISNNAFSCCTALTSIKCLADSVPYMEANAFEGCTLLHTIYIPCGTLEEYKTHWSNYANIIQYELSKYKVTIIPSEYGCVSAPTNVCDSVLTAMPNYGYHFVQWNDGNTDNPRTIKLTQDTAFEAFYEHNPVITYICDLIEGNIKGDTITPTGVAEDSITFEAVHKYGYHFVQWGDGNIDNPRTIYLSKDTTFTAEFAVDKTGSCGEDFALTWSYNDRTKVLTINGDGALTENCTFGVEAPTQMQTLIIGNGVTAIGDSAFYRDATINHLSIGSAMTTIGDYAFAECRNFDDITCYAVTVPVITSTTFANIGNKKYIYLYVPENRERAYLRDEYWGEFDVQVQSAETVVEPVEDVSVVPSDNTADIIWPAVDGAETYEIQITKDGEVICSLIFNKNGQLAGIAFAPSRGGERQTQQSQTGGFMFTVTGLTSNTNYGYSVTSKDENETTIDSKSGLFTTTDGETPEGFEDISAEGSAPRKVMIDGNVYILRGEKVYTLQGQEVR